MKTLLDPAHLSEMYDVLVIGGGNAALCAAITAREGGASVLLLEASPWEYRGGNSRHTRNLRYMHQNATAFLTGPYQEDEFFQDLMMVTKGNTDEELARFTIRESGEVGEWMMKQGVRFQPSMRGTLHLSRTNAFFRGGGKALVNAYYATCEKLGVKIAYEAKVTDLDIQGGRFESATVEYMGSEHLVRAHAVVAASGGFQADLDWLRRSWGEAAENFIVRGSPYDKGVVLKVLIDKGVQSKGDPSQCHCVAIDARAPKYDGGIVTRLDCVPFGVSVNREGKRFYNEGEEFWPKRYAIWGRLVAQQPGQIAYSIIDSKSIDLFMPSVFPPVEAGSVRELAEKLEIDPDAVEGTINEYNAATRPGPFDSNALDGLGTTGLEPVKTNWARPIDTPPFYGYPLRPGITFTYLSLKIDKQARVVMEDGTPAENIFAAGELVSGNVLGQGYMAGFGMTIGTVFGRIAGKESAKCIRKA
ncbi:FAD-dependent tricarballylate dehydrogenase TcuA [Pseudodesulfovibrio sp.]|uniref:FAD-dependent tricarballylate dehydrogenase TcuA n=1 Tax=unclassified Pseudodesulfovibrio TaxID=2661612 RepID=UPI003AFF8C96